MSSSASVSLLNGAGELASPTNFDCGGIRSEDLLARLRHASPSGVYTWIAVGILGGTAITTSVLFALGQGYTTAAYSMMGTGIFITCLVLLIGCCARGPISRMIARMASSGYAPIFVGSFSDAEMQAYAENVLGPRGSERALLKFGGCLLVCIGSPLLAVLVGLIGSSIQRWEYVSLNFCFVSSNMLWYSHFLFVLQVREADLFIPTRMPAMGRKNNDMAKRAVLSRPHLLF